ncbi:MAG: hypothetical protein ACOC7U_06120 [Spirochaetota bacterium]
MKEKHLSYITPQSMPFDPLLLARKTEAIVGQHNKRKHSGSYCVGVYGGISTGYTVGCCLRCIFCWVNPSRDFPHKAGKLFSPEEVARMLVNNARQKGKPPAD